MRYSKVEHLLEPTVLEEQKRHFEILKIKRLLEFQSVKKDLFEDNSYKIDDFNKRTKLNFSLMKDSLDEFSEIFEKKYFSDVIKIIMPRLKPFFQFVNEISDQTNIFWQELEDESLIKYKNFIEECKDEKSLIKAFIKYQFIGSPTFKVNNPKSAYIYNDYLDKIYKLRNDFSLSSENKHYNDYLNKKYIIEGNNAFLESKVNNINKLDLHHEEVNNFSKNFMLSLYKHGVMERIAYSKINKDFINKLLFLNSEDFDKFIEGYELKDILVSIFENASLKEIDKIIDSNNMIKTKLFELSFDNLIDIEKTYGIKKLLENHKDEAYKVLKRDIENDLILEKDISDFLDNVMIFNLNSQELKNEMLLRYRNECFISKKSDVISKLKDGENVFELKIKKDSIVINLNILDFNHLVYEEYHFAQDKINHHLFLKLNNYMGDIIKISFENKKAKLTIQSELAESYDPQEFLLGFADVVNNNLKNLSISNRMMSDNFERTLIDDMKALVRTMDLKLKMNERKDSLVSINRKKI